MDIFDIKDPDDPRMNVDVALITQGVEEVLMTLTYRERTVFKLRLYEEMTYEQIGNKFNVSRERVRQIYAKALRKLHHPYRKQILFRYL